MGILDELDISERNNREIDKPKVVLGHTAEIPFSNDHFLSSSDEKLEKLESEQGVSEIEINKLYAERKLIPFPNSYFEGALYPDSPVLSEKPLKPENEDIKLISDLFNSALMTYHKFFLLFDSKYKIPCEIDGEVNLFTNDTKGLESILLLKKEFSTDSLKKLLIDDERYNEKSREKVKELVKNAASNPENWESLVDRIKHFQLGDRTDLLLLKEVVSCFYDINPVSELKDFETKIIKFDRLNKKILSLVEDVLIMNY